MALSYADLSAPAPSFGWQPPHSEELVDWRDVLPARRLRYGGCEFKTVATPDGDHELVVGPSGLPLALASTFSGVYPRDPAERAWTQKMRHIALAPYERAFAKRLQLLGKTRSWDMAFNLLEPAEQKALAEGLDRGGGALVPPLPVAEILGYAAEQNLAFKYATVRPIVGSDYLALPTTQPSSAQPNIYTGGPELQPSGETYIPPQAPLALGLAGIAVRKFYAPVIASNDLLADAPYAPAELLRHAGENLGAQLAGQMTMGSGDALNWAGIINTPGIPPFDVTGTTSHSISNTTAAAGSATKLRAQRDALPERYWPGGRWLFSGSVRHAINGLVTQTGSPIMPLVRQPSVGGDEFVLDGLNPVSVTEWMPPDGAAGVATIFGDIRNGYTVALRSDIAMHVVRERYADTDQTLLVFVARLGGAVTRPLAFTLGTLS
jgi:HK97 family phage major capsid protein